MTELVLRVRGIHCPACPGLIDELLAADPAVAAVTTLRKGSRSKITLAVGADPGMTDTAALLARWNALLSPHGYELLDLAASGPWGTPESRRETLWGLGAGAVFLVLFALLQASGVLDLFSPETLEAPGAFVLGVIASVSSCFAVVGGLLVTFTAAVGQRNPQRLAPALTAFHLARLVAFVVLGGLLGQLGEAMALNQDVFTALYALASLMMLVLGLNLLGVLPSWDNGKRRTDSQKRWAALGTTGGGLLLGAATFFLPCGFTQSMQFQALAAGSFGQGALLMGAFAVGTLPVLLLASFALKAGLSGRGKRMLLPASGVVVLGLGLFQTSNVLRLWGVL